MKKFLVIGCGGSGNATIGYLIDQLRADLRALGVKDVPAAWQFLSIDVPPSGEPVNGLGTVAQMGGRYLSVSNPGNTYQLVANTVEQSLTSRSALAELIGWAPAPKESCRVSVTKGAGQYRAIGRMLTLTDLKDIRDLLTSAWESLQSPNAWGDLPRIHPQGGPYGTDSLEAGAEVLPIVVGSMAGGSGAAMFLDVCRMLGQLPGLPVEDLGVFLYTADVFAGLPASERAGVDANALSAIAEIIAAQSRSSDDVDNAMYQALGISGPAQSRPAFGRVFPIGSSIGGDGARFGDGTTHGVFRGLARALAATMMSHAATYSYEKSKVENPSPTDTDKTYLSWGTDTAENSWGSYGFASLSLGRDRYAEYASQRMARNAVDRLATGYLDPLDPLPPNEQLAAVITAQFPTLLQRLRLPTAGENVRGWFLREALPPATLDAEARSAISEAVTAIANTESGQALPWVDAVRVRLPHFQGGASNALRDAAYFWANGWASQLEQAAREEFLRSMAQLGLPYAVGVVRRMRQHLNPVIDALRGAPAMGDPLVLDPAVASRAQALKKTMVGAGHALAETITSGYLQSARGAMEREAARLGAEILASYAQEVLGGLERAGSLALQNIEAAKSATSSEAGLALLATRSYPEWPTESDLVPARFDHADNEVLLTTAADFPAQFASDVMESVPAAGTQRAALDSMITEIVLGRWETTGGARGDFPVLTQRVAWRPASLPKDPVNQTPTPKSQPVYEVAVSTEELLQRAHALLDRPDAPFERFSGQSIEDYLSEDRTSEAERARRSDELVARFRQTLMLARPLVGVNAAMIQVLHPGQSLTYQYSFSAVPLGPAVAQRVRALLSDQGLDSSTVRRFDASIDPTAATNKIAVFGSYPKYSPLVFSSMLSQIKTRWDAAPEQALDELWKWKRTRPLPAALAMGTAERHAMVMGWFLGRLLGAVSLPSAGATSPAQVWSFSERTWMPFNRRLLTPPSKFQSANDWLPSVLESHTLAIVQGSGDVTLGALRPYVALRSIWNDSAQEPQGAYGALAGVRHLGDWLVTGQWPAGRPSEIPLLSDAGSGVAEDRATASGKWLDLVADHIKEHFLTTGGGVGAYARRTVRVASVQELTSAPLFAEIAEIAMAAIEELKGHLDEAVRDLSTSGNRAGGGYADGIM